MSALRIIRQVDESLLAALPELRPWQGTTIELVATPGGVDALPQPPRRLPAGSAIGLLHGQMSLTDQEEEQLLEEARQAGFACPHPG